MPKTTSRVRRPGTPVEKPPTPLFIDRSINNADPRAVLASVAADVNAPASARTAAARALAEMDGLLGKHQRPDSAALVPLGELTRAELEAELASLRADRAALRSAEPDPAS